MIERKGIYMKKYIPVDWLIDTRCTLKRNHSSYTEEFSVLSPEVPMVRAVPEAEVRKIMEDLEKLGGYCEIIEYIKFLLKDE